MFNVNVAKRLYTMWWTLLQDRKVMEVKMSSLKCQLSNYVHLNIQLARSNSLWHDLKLSGAIVGKCDPLCIGEIQLLSVRWSVSQDCSL